MKKNVIFIQEDSCSCGSACIQSVVSHYGGYVPLETVLDDTNTTTTGTNAYEMISALKKYGFTSFAKNVTLKEISPTELPVIAHVIKDGLEHFVVVYYIDEKSVLTMDPACGEKRCSREYFEQIYDERAIFLFKEGELPNYKPTRSLSKVLKSVFNNYMLLVPIFILCLSALILNLVMNFHFKLLETTDTPIRLTALFILFEIFLLGICLIKNRLIEYLVEHINRSLTDKFTRHIFYLPLRILCRKRAGEIVKKIDDISFIKDLFIRLTIVNSLDILLLAGTILIMFNISKIMTAVYVIIASVISLFTILTKKKLYRKNKDNIRLHDEYLSNFVEYTSGLESIKNLNREEQFLKRLSASLESYLKNTKQLSWYTSFNREMKAFVLNSSILIINLIGFISLSETFTFFDLITMQSLFTLCTSSIESLLETSYHFARGKALKRSLSEFLDIEEEATHRQTAIGPFKTLHIENLSYSHDKIHKNIENIDITIDRGDKILLQGPSGVGKSTLVKCLCRRLENYEGRILLNGLNIKDVNIASLRKQIVYIGQEESLFSGTIKENVAGAHFCEDKFENVIELAALKDVLANKPAGRDATILEGASNFSGGERSRLILARALYEEPSILLIDETLSSVSETMEDEILTRLLAIRDLTIIYITHRNKSHLFQKKITL